MCTGGGIHYRGCTFITGGGLPSTSVASTTGGVPSLLGVCIPGCMCTGVASTTGGVPSLLGVCIPGRMCTGGGIHYRGCTFIAGGVHTRTHVYWGWHPLQGVYLHNWGGAIHYRGCTFIAGGVHTRMHVYWGWHPLQGVYLHCWGCAYQDACVLGVASTTGGVPSLLGVCIPGRMCTGGGIHYRGCTFITGGVPSTTGGVPSLLGVCIPGCMCTGGGIHYRGCTFIAGGVHTRTHVYWGWHPLQGVYLHCWGCAYQTHVYLFCLGGQSADGVHTELIRT